MLPPREAGAAAREDGDSTVASSVCEPARRRSNVLRIAPDTNICSHRASDGSVRAGGPGLEPDFRAPKARVLPITPPPKRLPSARARYYDARGARSHRRDPRRGRGDPHALRAAQGPAPALRAPDDPVADRSPRSEAGAGRVVVVDGPKRAARRAPARGRRGRRSRRSRNGTGDAVARGRARTSTPTRTVLVLNGDVPLITAEAIAALVARPRGERRRGHDGDDGARRPDAATAASSATPTAASSAWWRPRRAGDATPERARDPRGQHRHLRVRRRRRCSTRSSGSRSDNAQGELYLPDVLPLLRARGQAVAAHPITDPTLTLGVNDRVDLAAGRARSRRRASTSAHMLAGVTIVDPGEHADRGRRRRSAATR